MAELGEVANAIGVLLIAALGAAVVLLAPRRLANVALAAFAVALGGSGIDRFVEAAWADRAAHLLRLAASAALVAMAFGFPTPLERRERKLLLLPGALLIAAATAIAAGLPRYPTDGAGPLRFLAGVLATKLMLAVAVLLAARAIASRDAAAQKVFALPSAALLIFPVIITSPASTTPYEVWADWLGLAVTVAVALAWIHAGARGAVDPRLARHSAWWALGLALAGMLIGAPSVRGFGVIGLLMLATVALLAYAILHHQLLGIDVKLRWTISKSTLAAAFVAAFFLASEGAQLVLGEQNQWVGLVGAGALVFALAPLQRAAERLAEKAVPIVGAPGPMPIDAAPSRERREETYRAAVRFTLRDARMTKEEELHLAALATDLGLTPERAVALRHEVQDAQDDGGASRA